MGKEIFLSRIEQKDEEYFYAYRSSRSLYVCMYVCMYVCIRGGLLQPLHLDPQWSVVLNPDDR
jgi:hypothetical protein